MPSLGVTGDTLRDVSGNGNHGTLTNMDAASDWVTTSKGLALGFDGTDDHVVIPTFGRDLTSQATVSCIFRPVVVDSTWRKAIIQPYTTSWSAPYYRWQIGTYQNRLFCGFNVNNNYFTGHLPDTDIASSGNVYHVVGTFKNGVIRLFVNGISKNQSDKSSIATTIISGVTDEVCIGRDASYFNQERLNGNVYQASIYNRALSPQEIKQLYVDSLAPFRTKKRTVVRVPAAIPTATKVGSIKKPTTIIKPSYQAGYARNASESENPNLWDGLVGAWMPSLGVTGNTLRDVSGNGNDVVQVGAGAGWKASSLRNGSVNKYNPGINHYMIAEDAASLQPTSLTASFWVNVFALRNNESGFLDKQADPNASQNYLNTCFQGYVYAGYLLFRLASPSNANHVLIGDQSSFGGSNTLFSNFLNKWLHVACTYDEKTGQANLYRDGQKVVTRTSSPSPLKTGTGDLLLTGMNPVSRFCLNGLLNSMLIHNRALSPTEIKQLYLNPAAPFQKKTPTVVSVTAAVTPSATYHPLRSLAHPLEQ